MRVEAVTLVLLCCLFSGTSTEKVEKDGKVLSLFQIINFPNDACVGTVSKNGTCYTAEECSSKGGVNAGSCAGGYGVCCTFSVNCGGTSRENCTYFESTGSEVGACQVHICRCGSKVCQLRLDFNQFTIAGPSTSSVSSGTILNGELAYKTDSGLNVTDASQCLTDTFSVTNPGGGSPPTICGTNVGEHMYVDSSSCCTDLTFQLGTTSTITRQWSIKVTQYACDSPNVAPPGCTQYFYGSDNQSVKTFNFDGGQHLANQNQNICVRRERGNCRICWTTVADTDFAVSATSGEMKGLVKKTSKAFCCSYGTDGDKPSADCLVIPGARKVNTPEEIGASWFCGRSKGLGSSDDSMAAKTVCSNRTPFNIRFLSDSYEALTEITADGTSSKTNAGFKLVYFQTNKC